MLVGSRIDELHCYAHAATDALHARVDDDANSEIVADLSHRLARVGVGPHRLPADHVKVRNPAKLRNERLMQTTGEKLVRLVETQSPERQHGDGPLQWYAIGLVLPSLAHGEADRRARTD